MWIPSTDLNPLSTCCNKKTVFFHPQIVAVKTIPISIRDMSQVLAKLGKLPPLAPWNSVSLDPFWWMLGMVALQKFRWLAILGSVGLPFGVA